MKQKTKSEKQALPESKSTQAERITALFGGPQGLKAAFAAIGHTVALSTIYKWQYGVDKHGCGGVIPTQKIPLILQAAKKAKISITSNDLDPRL